MAQADPPSSHQPRRTSQPAKPTKRDPDFIYTDFQRQLDKLNLQVGQDVFLQFHPPRVDVTRLDVPFDANSGQQPSSSPAQPALIKKPKCSSRSAKPSKKDTAFLNLQGQMQHCNLLDDADVFLPSQSLYAYSLNTEVPPAANSSPQSASKDQDLSQEIRPAKLQKDKLALELEVLRLRHAPNPSMDDHAAEPTQTSSVDKSRKKRVIDWPHEFAPSNNNVFDYDKLELADFVTGFLAMIKTYDNPKKEAMLFYLELLMLKASSYSWSSVRAFHSHIAKQIELYCLKWTSYNEIRDKAVTFFKHSDLHSNQIKSSIAPISSTYQATTPHHRSSSKPEAAKACRQWNYYGSCSWLALLR